MPNEWPAQSLCEVPPQYFRVDHHACDAPNATVATPPPMIIIIVGTTPRRRPKRAESCDDDAVAVVGPNVGAGVGAGVTNTSNTGRGKYQSEGGESAAAPNGVLDSCLGVRGGWCQGQ